LTNSAVVSAELLPEFLKVSIQRLKPRKDAGRKNSQGRSRYLGKIQTGKRSVTTSGDSEKKNLCIKTTA
jgi:hypothetical protein